MSDSILLGPENINEKNLTRNEKQVQFAFAVFTIATNLVSSILNVIINGLLLHIHVQTRKSSSRILVFNLTLTDILTGLVVQPAYATHIILDINGETNYNAFLFFNFTAYLVCGMSLLTAGGMSIDRLAATVRPFSYKFYGKPRIYVAVVVLIWLQGLTFVSLYTANIINRVLAQMVFMLTVTFAVFSFVLSYAIIINSMRQRERRITQMGLQGPQSTRKKSVAQRNGVTKTFALMVIALCVMYLPMFVVKIFVWRANSSHIVALNIVNRLANTVTFLNSLLNPILYCYSNTNTKRQMKEMFFKFTAFLQHDQVQPVRTERITRNDLSKMTSNI